MIAVDLSCLKTVFLETLFALFPWRTFRGVQNEVLDRDITRSNFLEILKLVACYPGIIGGPCEWMVDWNIFQDWCKNSNIWKKERDDLDEEGTLWPDYHSQIKQPLSFHFSLMRSLHTLGLEPAFGMVMKVWRCVHYPSTNNFGSTTSPLFRLPAYIPQDEDHKIRDIVLQ